MKHSPELVASIKTAFERNGRAIELRPAVGQKTAITRVRVVQGVHCEAEEGRWKVVADASEKSGGTAMGPDPGLLVRSALGTCLAMGYVMWAAHMDVPLRDVEVEIQADFDARGQHDMADISPGYSEIRYLVRIDSDAPESDIQRVVETADRASMVGDVFRRAHTLKRTLTITRPQD